MREIIHVLPSIENQIWRPYRKLGTELMDPGRGMSDSDVIVPRELIESAIKCGRTAGKSE